MRQKIKSKKAQITIFVIIALIIVAAIALVFVVMKKAPVTAISSVENPRGYIEDCMKKSAENAVAKLIPIGGIANADKSFLFSGANTAFLCYTDEYQKLCTNLHPMLKKEIENQIAEAIKPQIDACFAKVKASLINENYKESGGNISAEIIPRAIIIKSDKKIAYSRNDQSGVINEFDAKIISAMWDFVKISNKIVNQELTCECETENCNADVVSLSLDNPEFELEHFVAGTSEEVYSIKEIATGNIFNIALKNCVRRLVGYTGA